MALIILMFASVFTDGEQFSFLTAGERDALDRVYRYETSLNGALIQTQACFQVYPARVDEYQKALFELEIYRLAEHFGFNTWSVRSAMADRYSAENDGSREWLLEHCREEVFEQLRTIDSAVSETEISMIKLLREYESANKKIMAKHESFLEEQEAERAERTPRH